MNKPVRIPHCPIWGAFVLAACEVNYDVLDRPHKQLVRGLQLFSCQHKNASVSFSSLQSWPAFFVHYELVCI